VISAGAPLIAVASRLRSRYRKFVKRAGTARLADRGSPNHTAAREV